MAAKRRGLGRDLASLLSKPETGEVDGDDSLRELPLTALTPGPHQPRRHFDEAALDALADSIRAQGVVQPIVVRPTTAGAYEIVAGERRWRAAQRAGLSRIPAVVRNLDTRSAMAVALVENIQRADLNPLEEAEALRRLIDECHLTHEQTAEAVGRSRAAISNLLRLLELPAAVQAMIRESRLSLGHAKVLLGAPADRQAALAQKVVALGLSVRQTELLLKSPVSAPQTPAAPVSPALHEAERSLRDALGVGVKVQSSRDGGGRVVIPFKDAVALDQLLTQMRLPR